MLQALWRNGGVIMTLFLWVMLVLYVLGAIISFVRLGEGDYPRTIVFTSWMDVCKLIANFCFALWALYLLTGGK